MSLIVHVRECRGSEHPDRCTENDTICPACGCCEHCVHSNCSCDAFWCVNVTDDDIEEPMKRVTDVTEATR